MLAETVGDEVVVVDIFHLHEALGGDFAILEHVEDRAHAGGGGDLNAGPVLAIDRGGGHAARIDFLDELAVLDADGNAEDHDHIIRG